MAKAAQNLVDNDFGGWVPGKAVSGSLRVAAKRNPRIALAAADVFRASSNPDPLLQERLVEIYHRLDQYPMATTMFAEIEANRPPDIQGPDWTAERQFPVRPHGGSRQRGKNSP